MLRPMGSTRGALDGMGGAYSRHGRCARRVLGHGARSNESVTFHGFKFKAAAESTIHISKWKSCPNYS
jgi:hypothetical protein